MSRGYVVTSYKDGRVLFTGTYRNIIETSRKFTEIFAHDQYVDQITIKRLPAPLLQPSGRWVIHAFYTEPHKPPYRTIGPFPSYREAYNWRYDPCNAETLGDVTDVKFAEIDSPVDE